MTLINYAYNYQYQTIKITVEKWKLGFHGYWEGLGLLERDVISHSSCESWCTPETESFNKVRKQGMWAAVALALNVALDISDDICAQTLNLARL